MKKSTAIILSLVIIIIGAVGGTVAWLTASTAPVKNTFTAGDIDIKLEETKNDFKMVPGFTIAKDPKITVLNNSEKCYLFAKLEKSANFDTYLTCETAEGWTALPGNEGVFYREVEYSGEDQVFSVLKNDSVTVKTTVTKSDMQAAELSAPTLTVTAYAGQYYKNASTAFTPAEAWSNFAA